MHWLRAYHIACLTHWSACNLYRISLKDLKLRLIFLFNIVPSDYYVRHFECLLFLIDFIRMPVYTSLIIPHHEYEARTYHCKIASWLFHPDYLPNRPQSLVATCFHSPIDSICGFKVLARSIDYPEPQIIHKKLSAFLALKISSCQQVCHFFWISRS